MTEQSKKTNGFAVASLVLGILSILFVWTFIFGLLLCVLAIVFGIIALKSKQRGRGLAIAGLVTGGIGALFTFIAFVTIFITAISRTPVTTKSTAQTTSSETKPQEAAPTAPAYTIAKDYGGGNKSVLISPSDATEEKLVLLGKDLNQKYGSGSFVRIAVFTDVKYALIFNDPTAQDALSTDGLKAYDDAYVAQFSINKNTGFKSYNLYPTRNQKEVDIF